MAHDQVQQQATAALTQQFQAEYVAQQVDALRKKYEKRKRDTESYCETLEIVISRLWRDAGLKPRGRRYVRSGLTIGLAFSTPPAAAPSTA